MKCQLAAPDRLRTNRLQIYQCNVFEKVNLGMIATSLSSFYVEVALHQKVMHGIGRMTCQKGRHFIKLALKSGTARTRPAFAYKSTTHAMREYRIW